CLFDRERAFAADPHDEAGFPSLPLRIPVGMTHQADGENGLTTRLKASGDEAGKISDLLLPAPWKRCDRVLVSGKTASGCARGRGATWRLFPFVFAKEGARMAAYVLLQAGFHLLQELLQLSLIRADFK